MHVNKNVFQASIRYGYPRGPRPKPNTATVATGKGGGGAKGERTGSIRGGKGRGRGPYGTIFNKKGRFFFQKRIMDHV